MNSLAIQQRALLRALWLPHYETAMALAGPHLARADSKALRGLRAYRSHGRALAERALVAAYPTVFEQLGDANFAWLARAHWLHFPPARGDVGQWGGQLPQHIDDMPQLQQDEPGLADVARVDWAMHVASTAADTPARPDTLKLLVQNDPARLTLRLAPGTVCVAGTLVWRQGLAPRKRPLAQGECHFIDALLTRQSLLQAIEGSPAIELQQWLPQAVNEGLVLGVKRLRCRPDPKEQAT